MSSSTLIPTATCWGVEIMARDGDGPQGILAVVADESIANALGAEGFHCPELRGNPGITIHRID